MWMAVLKGLETRDLWTKRITIPGLSCDLCNSSNERCSILFLDYSYNGRIWDSIVQKFKYAYRTADSIVEKVEQFLSDCDKSNDGNTVLAKLCFLAFVWNVWREWNSRIFKKIFSPMANHTQRYCLPNQSQSNFLPLMFPPILQEHGACRLIVEQLNRVKPQAIPSPKAFKHFRVQLGCAYLSAK